MATNIGKAILAAIAAALALLGVYFIPGSISLDEKGLVRVAQSFPDPATTMRRR